MTLALALLASVHAAEIPDAAEVPDAAEWKAADHRAHNHLLASQSPKYRLGRVLQPVGVATSAVGGAVLVGALVYSLGECGFDSCEETAVPGLVGLGVYEVGAVLASSGSLIAASALRRGGADLGVRRGNFALGLSLTGFAALGVYPVLFAIARHSQTDRDGAFVATMQWAVVVATGAPIGSLVLSGAQMRANRRAAAGISGLTVAPGPVGAGTGLVVHGRF
ncbi:MAG: hypothetical protein H6737_23875 [Alphaproteobacteria bacterium]|nr:hypothetical protein [Alphaproteobacteria bacterium]